MIRLPGIVLIAAWTLDAAPAYVDRTHPSAVLGEARHYRLFLPSGYATSKRAYPVIYYFHGHSDRYTLEKYDGGKDTVPKIAAFVARNPVVAVAVDGYLARDYTGFYGGAPWDLGEEGGCYDFGAYFLELVAHIDKTYRTIPTRRHRATSGLSMGGFMSLAIRARYPDHVGSASAFNPGPEFFAGGEGRRTLWRPKDHVTNHTRSMIRLVRSSGDYISQYHEDTHAAYARTGAVNFEYRRDEYHRHWATSIERRSRFTCKPLPTRRSTRRRRPGAIRTLTRLLKRGVGASPRPEMRQASPTWRTSIKGACGSRRGRGRRTVHRFRDPESW